MGHPVAEYSQNPPNARFHHPHLRPIQHDRLNHRHVNSPQGPGIHTLPFQHARNMISLLPCPLKVVDHCWPFAVRFREESPKVLKGGERVKGDPICSHRHLCPRPCLLLRQAAPLPFLLPAAKVRREGTAVEGLLRHKHVALGSRGVRSVTLLQDNHCIMSMSVSKVNPEVGPI